MFKLLKILSLAGILASCTVSDSSYTAAEKEMDLSGYRTFAWLPKDSASIQNVLYDNEIIEQEIIRTSNQELTRRGLTVNRDTPDVLLQYTLMVEKREQIVSAPVTVAPSSPQGYIPPDTSTNNTNAYNAGTQYGNNSYSSYNTYGASDSPMNLYNYSTSGKNVYNQGYNTNNYPHYSPYGFPSGSPYIVGNTVQEVTYREGTLIIDIIDRKKNQLIWRGWNTEALADPNNYKKNLPREVQEIFRKLPAKHRPKKAR